MSSIAQSLPPPPGELFLIANVAVVWLGLVKKVKPYFTHGVVLLYLISPVV
jgi:hypothetical protein